MSRKGPDLVSASEIAAWAWCPESWRLKSLGHEPENQAALRRGEAHHAEKAAFEERSRSAVSLGRWLIALGVVLLGLVIIYAVL
jgi:hypothetical protein